MFYFLCRNTNCKIICPLNQRTIKWDGKKQNKEVFVMKLGKLLLGAGVVTSALAVSAGFGVQSASAEEAKTATAISPKDITVAYASQKIIVKETNTSTTDDKLYVGVGSYKKGSTDITVKKWIEYDLKGQNEGVTIDTSSLAVTKKQYIAIKGDKNTQEFVVELDSTASKLSAAIDYTTPSDPSLVLNDITEGKSKAKAVSAVEFATGNDAWHTYHAENGKQDSSDKRTDLTVYQKFGATLKVRESASADKTVDTANASTVTLNKVSVKSYPVEGNFASKEVKVKVAKLAAGPKVAVNYTKNTVSLPATAEYRTEVGADKYKTDLVKSATKKTVVVPLADFKLSAVVTLDVRTAAKTNTADATKSKPASNITEVALPKVEALATKSDSSDMSKDLFNSGDLEKASVADGKVTFKYGAIGTSKATITSTDADNTYEVYVTTDSKVGYVGDADALVSPAATVKVTGKVTASKPLNLKGLKDGDKIFIRTAGNAKTKTFASDFGALGTVKLPAATATPAPSASAAA